MAEEPNIEPLDLSGESVGTEPTEPVRVPYQPDQARDKTREIVTLWLVGLLATVITVGFLGLFVSRQDGGDGAFFERLKTLLDVTVGPVITLLSTALGFYFGTQAAKPTNGTSSKA